MKLIIDIPEDDYKEVQEDTYSGTPFENRVFSAIANGTPLPKGRWIKHNQSSYDWTYKCDVCGCILNRESNYCPNCGAKMKSEG